MTSIVKASALVVSLLIISLAACGDDDDVRGGAARSDDGGTDGAAVARASQLSRASRGSALDIAEDDALLVAVNRDVGTVSVFDVVGADTARPSLTKRAEVAVCEDPWQVVLAPSGERAYVVCRKDQRLVRIDDLRTAPRRDAEVIVGSEPTSVAITPLGRSLWVSNWTDGTMSEVDAESMTVRSTVDLNAALVDTRVLGAVAARPGLAHPRNVAITNNKDESEADEFVFVAEFFAQQKEPLSANGRNADVARQGLVYKIGLGPTRTVTTIALPPIADTGIQDMAGAPVSCFPNQTQGVTVQGSFAYVLSVCASPQGPIADFTGPSPGACAADAECPGAAAGSCSLPAGICKTNCTTSEQCGLNGGVCEKNVCNVNVWNAKALQTPAVSIIDLSADKVVGTVALNGAFQALFDETGLPDTAARRYPATATELAFVPDTLNAYVVAKGADAVYRVDFNATYQERAVDRVGSPGHPFIPLDDGNLDATKQGRAPIAITTAHAASSGAPRGFAYVLNEATRNVTVLDLGQDAIAGAPEKALVVPSAPMPSDPAKAAVLEGKRLFDTGLGRWSFKGQAWGACESCHIDGLSDQVTWFHLKGPRQTPSLDQTVDKTTGKLRAMNWNAFQDELEDFEGGILRLALGGTGAIVNSFDLTNAARINFAANGHGGLNGSAKAAADTKSPSSLVGQVNVLDDWENLVAYQSQIRSPRKPSTLDPAAVAAGRALFAEANCQGCHGGSHWTISDLFYAPDPAAPAAATNTNVKLRSLSWTDAVAESGFPQALLPATGTYQTMRYNGTNAAFDGLTCLLRPVGTYGVGEEGVTVPEVRRDHVTPAQGNQPFASGYSTPSLLGLAVNAPYFHAGNARTLEGLLSTSFEKHHGALRAAFLAGSDPAAAEKRAALVAFLLSIDAETSPIPVPALGPNGGSFCAAP